MQVSQLHHFVQELMDAGRVQFVSGANVDLNLADGFKNTDVYCVPRCRFAKLKKEGATEKHVQLGSAESQ